MKKITLLMIILFPVTSCFSACDKGNDNGGVQTQVSKLKITIGEQVLTATLADNPTAKDFVTLLPLTMELSDYNNTERIFTLPRKLTTKGAPSSIDPDAGDITYYPPWGNIAIFYKDFRVSNGLVRIGKFDNGIEALQVSGSVQARIEVIEAENGTE